MGTLAEIQELFASLPPYKVEADNPYSFGTFAMEEYREVSSDIWEHTWSPIQDIVRPERLPSYQLTNLVDGARALMTTSAEPVSWVILRKTHRWLYRMGQKAEARARRVVRQQQRKRRRHRAVARRKRRGLT